MFLGCILTVTEDNETNELVDGSIVWLLRLDAWVGNFVNCLTTKETQGIADFL